MTAHWKSPNDSIGDQAEAGVTGRARLAELVLDARLAWVRARDALRRPRAEPMRDRFVRIYRDNAWGDSESVSGPGSAIQPTSLFRDQIPLLLRDVGARSLLDAPCGDFNWMRMLDLGATRYVGVDVVPELIAANQARYGDRRRRFLCLDITRDRLPRVDVIFCRDCLVHLSFADIAAALRNFKRSGSTFLIATTFVERNRNDEIATGGWRPLNLERPPFVFPPPLRLIDEGCTEGGGRYRDKHLGLWRLKDLAA